MKAEKFWQWLSFKLPRSLIYFCAIRLWAFATTGKYQNTVAPEITVDEALRRWDNYRKGADHAEG